MYTKKGFTMTKMMRISPETAKNLAELAKNMRKSKQRIMEEAIQAYLREQFLKKTNAEYLELIRDKKAYNNYEQENSDWDVTLLDGLLNHEE